MKTFFQNINIPQLGVSTKKRKILSDNLVFILRQNKKASCSITDNFLSSSFFNSTIASETSESNKV